MAAATTLGTAEVIFHLRSVVRYDASAGRTRVLTVINWSPFSPRSATILTSLLVTDDRQKRLLPATRGSGLSAVSPLDTGPGRPASVTSPLDMSKMSS